MIPNCKISVVIICKNSANTIERTVHSSLLLSDDVIVLDSGSTDGTIEKVSKTPATLKEVQWAGYGNAKNIGNKTAKNDWIVSIDADEYMDEKLIASLKQVDLTDESNIFSFLRLNYLGSKPIYYGEWGNDIVLRVFNKKNARWDITDLHEQLIIKNTGKIVKLRGVLHHFTAPDIKTYRLKLRKYAELIANKYYKNGKQVSWLKLYLSPVINFILSYVFKAGFLNGKEGLQIALAHAGYTFKKYRLLKNKIMLGFK